MRIKAIIMEFVSLGKFVESVLEWERPLVTVVVFVAFVTLTYYFQPYMFPIGLLLIFLKNYIVMGYQAWMASLSLLDLLLSYVGLN